MFAQFGQPRRIDLHQSNIVRAVGIGFGDNGGIVTGFCIPYGVQQPGINALITRGRIPARTGVGAFLRVDIGVSLRDGGETSQSQKAQCKNS